MFSFGSSSVVSRQWRQVQWKVSSNQHELTTDSLITFSSHWNILRTHFQALILIFPNHGGVVFQQLHRECSPGDGEQVFGVFGSVFELVLIILCTLLFRLFPVGHGVNRRVFVGPFRKLRSHWFG